MSDNSEDETIIDAIDIAKYGENYGGKDNIDKADKIDKSDQLSGNTVILPPDNSKSGKKSAAAPASKKSKSSFPLIAAVAGAVIIIAGILVFSLSDTGDDDTTVAETQPAAQEGTPAPAVTVSAADLYVSASAGIDVPDDAVKSLQTLKTLAVDSAYIPAMLEYGILTCQPTKAFPEIAKRQQDLGISPDLDASTRMLTKVLENEPDNYKAAYWIYNNLMTKFDRNIITADETRRLVSAFKIFKSNVDLASDADAPKYKNAMISAADEDTLRAWALI